MLAAAAAAAAASWQLRAFGGALAFFHASEFLLAAVYMRDQLSARCEALQAGSSFAAAARKQQLARLAQAQRHGHCSVHAPATHRTPLCLLPPPPAALLLSWPYVAAMSCGLAEFLVEAALLPGLKQQLGAVSAAGLALLLAGEAIRKTAMVRAGAGRCAWGVALQQQQGGGVDEAGSMEHAALRAESPRQ